MTAFSRRGLMAASLLPGLAHAQPAFRFERPLRLVVGFAPGGTADAVAEAA